MAVGKTPEKPQQSDDAASEAGGSVQTGSQANAQGSLDDRLRKLESHLAAKGVGGLAHQGFALVVLSFAVAHWRACKGAYEMRAA